MTTQQWTIGSDSDADLTVIDATVSRKHCRLSKTEKGYFLEDLVSRNGTFVDGERVVKRTPVTPKSKIILAESVPMPWPDESLARQTIRIGRHVDNDLVLDHESVSTHHAVLMCDVHGRWLVRDLNSTNGTGIGTPYKRIRAAYVPPEMPLEFGSVGASLDQWLETIAQRRAAMLSPASPDRLPNSDMATAKGKRVETPSTRSTVVTSPSSGSPLGWIKTRKSIASLVSMLALIVLGIVLMFWPNMFWSKGNNGVSSISMVPKVEAGTVTDTPRASSLEKPSVAPETPGSSGQPIQSVGTSVSIVNGSTSPQFPPNPDLKPPAESSAPSPVTAMERLQMAMVLIVTTDRQGQVYRHSSGLAVGPRSVLTTGSATEAIELGDNFNPPQILHVATGRTFTIQQQIPSLKLTESLKSYQSARTKRKELQEAAGGVPPDDETTQQMKQLAIAEIMHAQLVRVHDLGLLVTEEELPNFVDGSSSDRPWLAPPDTSPPALTSLSLVGPFFPEDGRAMFDEKLNIRTQTVKPLKLLPRVSPSMQRLMLAKMPGGLTLDQNFGGCMIVDSSERVVGMFTRSREANSFGVDASISQAMSGNDLLFDMISTEVIFEFLNSQLPST